MPRLAGTSLLELLVVLTIVVSLAGTVAWWFRPPLAERSARAYRATVHAARIEALAGDPVSVRFVPERRRFLVRRGSAACDGPVVRTLVPEPRVAVVAALRDGVVWLPDGTGRSCSGGGVYGGRVRFEGPEGDVAEVVVASTGRIRIERPDDGGR